MHSTEAALDEPADIVVSETFGVLLLQEDCLASLHHAKHELANVFIERCTSFLASGGTALLVLPQNWLYQKSYREHRRRLLESHKWWLLARLGAGAFTAIGGEVVKVVLLAIGAHRVSGRVPLSMDDPLLGFEPKKSGFDIDVSSVRNAADKAKALRTSAVSDIKQEDHLKRKDFRVLNTTAARFPPLSEVATALHGQAAGDNTRFNRLFWEVGALDGDWERYQGPPGATREFTGRQQIVYWQSESGEMAALAHAVKKLNHKAQQWRSGKPNWEIGFGLCSVGASGGG